MEAGQIDVFAVSRDPRAHLLRKAWFVVRHRPGRTLVGDRAKNLARLRGVAGAIADALGL